MNDLEKSKLAADLRLSLNILKGINSHIKQHDYKPVVRERQFNLKKVLIANRGEIAKRFFISLHEEGISSVAVVTDPDRGQSWYDFADEVVFIGDYNNYSNPNVIAAAVMFIGANAVYSGYGFLSENPNFVRIIDFLNSSGMHRAIFMGPDYNAMRMMGDKVSARRIAAENGIPLFKSSAVIATLDYGKIRGEAERIGFPVIFKPSAGGGGKGMVTVHSAGEVEAAADYCMRTGSGLYDDPSFYIEKLIAKPIHIEVQIFNGWVIGIRKCAVQRRNQKIIEESGEIFLDGPTYDLMVSISEKIARLAGYANGCGAGTIEFLVDQDTGGIGFLEMNTRLQVEYAVTDQSLDIDLVKCQIQLYDGREDELNHLSDLKRGAGERNHAIECRIYAEEPENNYNPSPGVISEFDLPTFNGIRCDFGFKEGDTVLPMYDPMIGKLIVHGRTRNEALIRLERALQEIYIKGVKTNIPQLLRIIRHPVFADGHYNNNFLSENNDLNPSPSVKSAQGGDLLHVIVCAFAEYLRLMNSSVSEFSALSRIDGILNAACPVPQSDFSVEYLGCTYEVRILQVSFNTFLPFVDQREESSITLNFSNDLSDNIIVNVGNHHLRVRVDRRADSVTLRMKDDLNKIQYYSMRINPSASGVKNRLSVVRSPFQGTLIGFCRNFRPGDEVRASEPMAVLSSMKMETTICAPSDGRLVYVIDLGAPAGEERIQSGERTAKSIQEGETLFRLEDHRSSGTAHEYPEKDFSRYFDREGKSILSDPVYFSGTVSRMYSALLFGFINFDYVIELMQRVASRFSRELIISSADSFLAERIEKSILHYIYIRKMFSTAVAEGGISYYDELSLLISGRIEGELLISPGFYSLLGNISRSYGLPDDIDVYLKKRGVQFEKLLMHMRLSYEFISGHQDFVAYLVDIFPRLGVHAERISDLIDLFGRYGNSERDVNIVESLNKAVRVKKPDTSSSLTGIKSSMGSLPGTCGSEKTFTGEYSDSFCSESLARPESVLLPESLAGTLRDSVEEKIKILKNRYHVERLKSQYDDVLIYCLKSHNGELAGYVSYAKVDGADKDTAVFLYILMAALQKSAVTVLGYQRSRAAVSSFIHLISSNVTVGFSDLTGGCISYTSIKQACTDALAPFAVMENLKCIVEIDIVPLNGVDGARRDILFYNYMGRTVSEFLCKRDSRNIYCDMQGLGDPDQRLFNINKWPVEIWASECFDSGVYSELIIETIDFEPGSVEGTARIVGAKIYTGRINGSDACFFMKDSRINSGSTGNYEGLKYAAASYISYLKGWTLYVWNDGAGANIRQGLVGLNRGAEGFMMNTLQTSNDREKFRRFMLNNPDPSLESLFKTIDRQYGLSIDDIPDQRRPLSLVAVGVGSSAGLDVYGSSQAVIQVMLDSEQSYRVLTGSNVIKSIIGEDISNYDIGGAKMICRYAGIADLMVMDKIGMIHAVRRIHRFFSRGEHSGVIKRRLLPVVEKPNDPGGMIALTEELIRSNVDDADFFEFRKEYLESDSLIAGFARLGGARTLILSTRTDSGLMNNASVIKGRELLKTANRVQSNSILIFGREFIQQRNVEEGALLPRRDFIETLRAERGLKIHIITHLDGLKLYYINSAADIVIFVDSVKNRRCTNRLVSKNAAFIVDTIQQAFDLSCGLIYLFSKTDGPSEHASGGMPHIPADPSTPFDIISSIIEPVVDRGSFFEMYSDMNNPESGPMLITGLARLAGRTVGIIADQPIRKGGAADAYGTEKFRIFTQLLNRKRIPLVMLSNSSGFMPGSKQERLRIQAIGAESLDVNILGEIPVVSVVFNQNYGGRLIHSFNKFLRPGIVYLSFADSILAVIGARVAFDLLYRKKYDTLAADGKSTEAEALMKNFLEDYNRRSKASSDGLASGLVDWIIPEIKDLRENIVKGLDLAEQRCRDAFN